MALIAHSASPQPEEIAARAEQELTDEIRRIFLKANAQYQMKHYADAARLFGDCYALYLASADFLSAPSALRPMAESCERHLDHLARLRQQEAVAGGWQARMRALKLKQFRVQQAGLRETLEYFRQRVGKTMGVAPPAFVFAATVPQREVTLDLEDVNAIYVLEELAAKAGWEVRFEKHAIVFSELAKSR